MLYYSSVFHCSSENNNFMFLFCLLILTCKFVDFLALYKSPNHTLIILNSTYILSEKIVSNVKSG